MSDDDGFEILMQDENLSQSGSSVSESVNVAEVLTKDENAGQSESFITESMNVTEVPTKEENVVRDSINVADVLADESTKGRRVLLGCSGSVASIKVPLIARALMSKGCSVIVLPTKAALHFLKVNASEENSSVAEEEGQDEEPMEEVKRFTPDETSKACYSCELTYRKFKSSNSIACAELSTSNAEDVCNSECDDIFFAFSPHNNNVLESV